MDRLFIEQYASGADRLRAAINGLSKQDLLWKPPADAGIGLWSIQHIVIHLMDSDLIGIDRMKRTAAEPNPLLIGFNEKLFVENLFYDDQSIEDAIVILDLSRKQFAKVLRKLPDQTFDRTAVHNERGMVTLGKQVLGYDAHLDHHIGFIHKKRAKLGKAVKA